MPGGRDRTTGRSVRDSGLRRRGGTRLRALSGGTSGWSIVAQAQGDVARSFREGCEARARERVVDALIERAVQEDAPSERLVALRASLLRNRRHLERRRYALHLANQDVLCPALVVACVDDAVHARHLLRRIMAALDPLERQLFASRLAGQSYQEIAHGFGTTAQGVRLRVHRVRRRLSQLGLHPEDPPRLG